MAIDEALATLEALLLLAPDGLEAVELGHIVARDAAEVELLLHGLDEHYRVDGHGLRVQFAGTLARLATAAECGDAVRRFLGLERPARLSPAAQDTLAIIAYRQPVTRTAIEAIRGVGSDHVLAVLLNLGLIEEVGRAESIGRPVLYGTSTAFLESTGIASLAELPPLPDA